MKKKYAVLLLVFASFKSYSSLTQVTAKIITMMKHLRPNFLALAPKNPTLTYSVCRFNPYYVCGSKPCVQCPIPLTPQNNGLTKCLIGQPHYFCEAWPCSFCPKTNLPPFAKKNKAS